MLAFVGGVVPLALAAHFDSWGIPRNDDWAYVLSAFRLADGGGLDGYGWPSMNLVGQLVAALPAVWIFGHRIAALQVEVAIFGVAGLVALFDLARQLLSPRRALFVALMVAVGPLWLILSASFMTDIPAFALGMICLAVGARAVRGDELDARFFVLALMVGLLGFTIREYAIVAPSSVALVAFWTGRRWTRPRLGLVIVLAVGVAVAAVGFYAWRRGLSGSLNFSPRRPTRGTLSVALHATARSAVLVGLLAAPAVVLVGPARLVRAAWARAPRVSAAVALLTAVGLVVEVVRTWSSGSFLGPGNYVIPDGALGIATVVGVRPDLLPKSVLALLAVIGIASMVLLLLAAVPPVFDTVRRWRQEPRSVPASPVLAIIAVATIGFAVAPMLPAVFGLVVFDRYLVPIVPLVGTLVLHSARERRASTSVSIASTGALALLAVFGLIYAANAASFDGTKWRLAEQVTSAAGGPRRVDGGFEWTNYHAEGPVFRLRDPSEPRDCVVVRSEAEQPDDAGVLRSAAVWGPRGTQVWMVARRAQC